MSERTPQRRRPQARPPAAGGAPLVGLSLPAASGKGILERDPRCLIASRVETCPRPGSAGDSLRKHHARCERGSYDLFPLRMKNSARTSSFASGSKENISPVSVSDSMMASSALFFRDIDDANFEPADAQNFPSQVSDILDPEPL